MVRTITAHLKANPDAFVGDIAEESVEDAKSEAVVERIVSEPAPDGATA